MPKRAKQATAQGEARAVAKTRMGQDTRPVQPAVGALLPDGTTGPAEGEDFLAWFLHHEGVH